MLAEVSPSAGGDVSVHHSPQRSLGQEEATAQVQPAKSLQVLPKKEVRTYTTFDVTSKARGVCS